MSEFLNLSLKGLKSLCKQEKLSSNGTRRQILNRLKEYYDQKNKDDSVLQRMMNNSDEKKNNGGDDDMESIISEISAVRLKDLADRPNEQRSVKFTFKDIEESLEEFDGGENKDPVQWLNDFEEQAIILKWCDDEKLVYARRLMKGAARSFVKLELKPKTWFQFKNGLISEFQIQVNGAMVHKRLSESKKKSNESYREYCYRMIDIASPANIDMQAVITYIVDGIPDSVSNKMFLYSSKSIRELKEKLVVYESVQMKKDVTKQQQPVKNNNSTKNKENSEAKSSNGSGKTRRCYGCGSDSHESKMCPDKDRGPKCFSCNSFGHKSNTCPGKKSQETTVKTDVKDEKPSMRFMSKRKKVSKDVLVNGKMFKALFDTGSDFTIIRKDVFDRSNLGEMKNTSFAFDGVGSSNKAIGEFEITVGLDNVVFKDVCYVVSSNLIQEEMIIGMSLMDQADEVCINKDGITFKKFESKVAHHENFMDELPVCAYMTEKEVDLPDINHIVDKNIAKEVEKVVAEYEPKKTKESPIEMKIVLMDEKPIYLRARRFPPKEKELIDKQVREWLKDDIIQPSVSDFAAPIVPVPKKEGSLRVCVDYQQLNKKIVKDRFPLPIIDDQIDALQGAKVFTTLDLANGFLHVPVAPESRKYTAFVTTGGQYEFLRVPFGLSVGPPVFQRFINTIFGDLIANGTIMTYMDDVIIKAADEDEALQKLKEVLMVAGDYGLNIKWKKCKLLQRKIEFLGYEVEDGKIRPAKAKTNDVNKYKIPKNHKQVERFLGFAGYFRKFIPDFAIIAKPLSDLMKNNASFVFKNEQHAAFEELKRRITERPVLSIFQHGLETEVHTDASKHGMGAILFQRSPEDNQLHPVRYMSLKTSDAESKCSSYELEVLAIVKAVGKWRVYLLSQPFKIITDCKAFAATMQKKDVPKIARWSLKLQEFDFQVIHRSGNQMKHVDALSRAYVMQEAVLISRLKIAQREDEQINAIIDAVKKGGKLENYELTNDLLYRHDKGQKLIVVPELMQFELIRRAHDQGHFKVKKMEDIITRDYYIPKLTEKAERVIRNCVACILSDRKAGKAEGFLNPIPKEDLPLSTFHLDHLGPMASTNKNYKHILAIVDAFTKFVWLFPVKTTTADETLKKLQIVINVFGNPSRIITDKGTAFTSRIFEEFCHSENIELVHITTGVPRGNGQVERMNRVIISVIAKLSIEDPEKWYQHTNKVQQFINKTYQRSIDTSPFQLLCGVSMKTKEDVHLREMIDQEMIESFNQDRNDLRHKAKAQIVAVQKENRRYYNSKRKPAVKYNVGDLVAIKRTQFGVGLKLNAKNLGPYEVIKVKRNDRYDVKKVGNHDGPFVTSSSADNMIKWADFNYGASFGSNDGQVAENVGNGNSV